MLTVFFDYRGVVHYEFLPTAQTVNKEYYLSVMRHLCEATRKIDRNYGTQIFDLCYDTETTDQLSECRLKGEAKQKRSCKVVLKSR